MSTERIVDHDLVVIDATNRVGGYVAELVARRELLLILIWRDIKVRYKQTVFGVLWALLVPLLQTVIFTVIFGHLAKIKPDGPYSYSVFALAGLIPWTFFSQAMTLGGQSLINQQHLLTKIYFPRVFVPAGAIGSCFVDFAVGMFLYAIVMAVSGIMPSLNIIFLPALIVLMLIATLGVTLWLAALTVTYRDFKYIIPFGVQVLMYASPIVYPSDLVPSRYKWLFGMNPMAGVIDGFRSAILGKPWDIELLAVSSVSAIVLFVIGVTYFRSTERRFADIA